MSYGQNSTFGIIFQNSYDGQPGDTGSMHWIPFLSSSVKLNKPPLKSENIRGIIDEGDSYEGPNTVEGEVEFEAQPLPLGAMLKSIMDLSSSTLVDSVYQHFFQPRVNDFDELCANNPVTLYQYLDTGSAMQYPNCTGSTLEISIANGEFLKAKVAYVGGHFTQTAAVAASFPVGKRWTWAVASLSFGGAGIDEVQDMTITMDDGGIEAMHTINNSLYPSRIKRTGWRTVTVDGTIKFDNQTEYQQFLSQSERELVLTFTGPTEIASGYYDEFTVKLPAMRYTEYSAAPEGPGEIEASFSADAKYSVDSGTAMMLFLTNTQAAY